MGNFNADLQICIHSIQRAGGNCMGGMQNLGVNSDLLLQKSNQHAGVPVKAQN